MVWNWAVIPQRCGVRDSHRRSRTEERSITGLYQGIHGGESEPKVILLWRVKITMIFPRSTSRLPAHRG
jgi:hypothetical protein